MSGYRITTSRALIRLLRVSYIGIEKSLEVESDFKKWCRIKARLTSETNRTIFLWLASQTAKSHGCEGGVYVQSLLDMMSSILLRHYKRRVVLYKLCQKFPRLERRLFLLLSLAFIFFDQVFQLAKSVAYLSVFYDITKYNLSNRVDVALMFPAHAFSLETSLSRMSKADGKECLASPSLGEYIFRSTSIDKCDVLSIDEYERPSRRRESAGVYSSRKQCQDNVAQLPRKVLIHERSARKFVKRVPKLLSLLGELARNSLFRPCLFIYHMELARWRLRGVALDDLLINLSRQNISVGRIFVAPFNELGVNRLSGVYKDLYVGYSYSTNIFIPPLHGNYTAGSQMPGINEILADLEVGALYLTGPAIGFDGVYDVVDRIKSRLNKLFHICLPISGKVRCEDKPFMMGFEKHLEEGLRRDRNLIAVFDVPPESRETQLSRALVGDRICDYSIIEEFLVQTISACVSAGFSVVYKPKYSLSNYEPRYLMFLENLRKEYTDKLIIVDPYVNLIELSRILLGAINIPYTSTKIVVERLGKPSIYFVPDAVREGFQDGDVVKGQKNLDAWLMALRGNKKS